MSGERFTLDTNILVYAFDSRAPTRQNRALSVLEASVGLDCVLSLQALGEFFAVVTRKGVLDRQDAIAQIRDWLKVFDTATADAAALAKALGAVESGRLSYWDALLVATAHSAGCLMVLSEDMAEGPYFGCVRVYNPFNEGHYAGPVAAVLSAS